MDQASTPLLVPSVYDHGSGYQAPGKILGVVLLVGVPMRRRVWACRRQATWFQLLLCSPEDLRFLDLGGSFVSY